ncbi:hypothetical protein BG015_001340 [Linnemannia schmuckeri]|uniref:Uncharacterized protein n=1 Tax=Linnemannia schmuckeri TaxID=64567 RepID=A0A9P5S3Z6_9FUNG|nr:hypothetical protein BG015_001340 [Linnemannia schmuckeri]
MDNLAPTNSGDSSNNAPASPATATGVTGAASRKPPGFRNLQPRAAARMDFNDNDSDDEDSSGILSADYIAQRKTTQDLVDFFKSAPPPSPPQQPLNLSPIEDEKKKKPLLQWLRPKKSGSNLNATSSNAGGSTLGGIASGRNSMLVQGASGVASNISTVSGVTMGKGKNGEDITTSTLPNGRKYIMIAIDYKEGEDGETQRSRSAGGANSDELSISNGSFMTTTRLPNGGTVSSRRQSRVPDDATTLTIDGLSPGAAAAKRLSILSSTLGNDLNGSGGGEKRRSILQTNTTISTTDSISDGSKYVLGGSSFLLENLALDTDFMGQATGVSASGGGPASSELQRSASNKSGAAAGGGEEGGSVGISRTGSKRGNKVKFSLLGDPNADGGVPLDEAVVAEALAQRLASYKAQQQGKSTTTTTAATTSTSTTTTTDGGSSCTSQEQQDYPEIVLPRPVSRKKVRHVQIQTQHCVMRAMHTQTEPYENLVHDLDIKEWSSVSGSTEVGSTTAGSTITSSSAGTPNLSSKKDASAGAVTSARSNSKVASLVASLTQPTAATTATTTTLATHSAATSPTTTSPPTPFPNPIDGNNASLKSPTTPTATSTFTETSTAFTEPSSTLSTDPALLHEELAQLREQNASLQTKVSSLERDLAAETRARNRTAVAMQDTRDKFEMLSAMAYKKLKEMIFQRHILEMEVRELRAQVDLHSEVSVVREGEMLFRQEQQQQQLMHQQQQYLYQTA